MLLRDLEQRARVDLGDLLHQSAARWLAAARPGAGERLEVELRERLVDQPAVVVVVERLARDLLRRHHRQVGHLAPDLVDRAARLLLDVAARLLHQLLALLVGVDLGLVLELVGRLARAGRRSRRPARAPRAAARGTPGAACRPRRACARRRRSTPRSPCAACRAPPRCAGTRACAGSADVIAERDQRPDHHADARLDQEVAAAGRGHRRDVVPRVAIRLARGRRRSGRR